MRTESVVALAIVAAFAVCGIAWGRWKWVGRGSAAIIVVAALANAALGHGAQSKRALGIATVAVMAFALGVLLRQLTSAAARRDLRRRAGGLPGGVPAVSTVILLAVSGVAVGAALPQPTGRRVVLVTVLSIVLLATALFVRKLWSDIGRPETGLGNLYRPTVPVGVGRTAAVLAAMGARAPSTCCWSRTCGRSSPWPWSLCSRWPSCSLVGNARRLDSSACCTCETCLPCLPGFERRGLASAPLP